VLGQIGRLRAALWRATDARRTTTTTMGIAPSSPSGADPLGLRAINLDHLANVTSLGHERWKRAHPEFCRKMGIR